MSIDDGEGEGYGEAEDGDDGAMPELEDIDLGAPDDSDGDDGDDGDDDGAELSDAEARLLEFAEKHPERARAILAKREAAAKAAEAARANAQPTEAEKQAEKERKAAERAELIEEFPELADELADDEDAEKPAEPVVEWNDEEVQEKAHVMFNSAYSQVQSEYETEWHGLQQIKTEFDSTLEEAKAEIAEQSKLHRDKGYSEEEIASMVQGLSKSYEKQLQMIRQRFTTYESQMKKFDPDSGVLGSYARLEVMNKLKAEIAESKLFQDYDGLYLKLRATKFQQQDAQGRTVLVPALAEDFATRRQQFAYYVTLFKNGGKMPVAQAKPQAPDAPKPPTPRQIAKRLARMGEVKPSRRSQPKPSGQPQRKPAGAAANGDGKGYRIIGKSPNAGVRQAEQEILRRMGY